MKVVIEKQEKNVAQINLDIPVEHAVQEYNKACRRLSQRLNIPGFRRGKAPRAMVEKTVGVERIKQEALERILPHAFADAISEHQLDVVAPPQVETFSFDLQGGIQVKANVELRPEVTVPDLSLQVTVPEYKHPEDAEQKELNNLVERMITLEPVIDRPVVETDIVNIDFSGAVNGEAIRGGSAKNYRLDLVNNNFIEGFATQIVGHKLSEEFVIQVTFPEDYHDAALAGKPADFTIKINEIKKRVVPELTDELAQKVGPYENVEQLKTEVREALKRSEDQENQFRKQKSLVEELVKRADVDIPDSMINREARILLEEVQQRFKSQGLSWEEFLDSQGHEAIWENLRSEARNRIKTSLVFGAVAKQEGLAVTEDEFSSQVQEIAQLRNVEEKVVMRQLANNPQAVQALSDQILAQKIVDFLMERATFTLVPEGMEATVSPASESSAGAAASGEPVAVAAPGIQGEEFEVIADE
jgi:trigger factor